MITAQWVRSRLRIAATLTTVTKSSTERDDMNRPVEVTVDTAVRCYLDPQTSAETSDGQVVGTAKFVGYVPACVDVSGADRLTVLGAPYEIVGLDRFYEPLVPDGPRRRQSERPRRR